MSKIDRSSSREVRVSTSTPAASAVAAAAPAMAPPPPTVTSNSDGFVHSGSAGASEARVSREDSLMSKVKIRQARAAADETKATGAQGSTGSRRGRGDDNMSGPYPDRSDIPDRTEQKLMEYTQDRQDQHGSNFYQATCDNSNQCQPVVEHFASQNHRHVVDATEIQEAREREREERAVCGGDENTESTTHSDDNMSSAPEEEANSSEP